MLRNKTGKIVSEKDFVYDALVAARRSLTFPRSGDDDLRYDLDRAIHIMSQDAMPQAEIPGANTPRLKPSLRATCDSDHQQYTYCDADGHAHIFRTLREALAVAADLVSWGLNDYPIKGAVDCKTDKLIRVW